MYSTKLHIYQIFSNLWYKIFKLYNLSMRNLYTKFVKFLEICKQFSKGLVAEKGNILRPGPVPRFSDLEVIAMSMAAESEEIDSENWLFEARLKECKDSIPNLISRRLFNDRRKAVSNLQEKIRSRMAEEIDGVKTTSDSRPIEVCRVARGKCCKMGRNGDFAKTPDFGYCASQGCYLFGYKLHALCGLSGVIHSYDLSKASVHDIHYIKDIKTIYHDCCIIGDKGYIGVERCNLTCSKQQTPGSNVHTDSIKRIGSLLFLHLQRREKE